MIHSCQSIEAADEFTDVHALLEQHYTSKVIRHGPTALGVDWTCTPTQELRFVQLLKLCDFEHPFSINDIGCGYGALLGFMGRRYRSKSIDYLGVDLSTAMIAEARRLWSKRKKAAFEIHSQGTRVADYSVASGIFNIKFLLHEARWTQFVMHTLDHIHAKSRKGFAVNFLKQMPRNDASAAELYRTTIDTWKELCRTRYKAEVHALSQYGMQEFTLLVRY